MYFFFGRNHWNHAIFLGTYLNRLVKAFVVFVHTYREPTWTGLSNNSCAPFNKPLLPCSNMLLIVTTDTSHFHNNSHLLTFFCSFGTVNGVLTHINEPFECTWQLMTKLGKKRCLWQNILHALNGGNPFLCVFLSDAPNMPSLLHQHQLFGLHGLLITLILDKSI